MQAAGRGSTERRRAGAPMRTLVEQFDAAGHLCLLMRHGDALSAASRLRFLAAIKRERAITYQTRDHQNATDYRLMAAGARLARTDLCDVDRAVLRAVYDAVGAFAAGEVDIDARQYPFRECANDL